MNVLELVVAHAVKLALAALLLGLLWRGRARQCWSFTVYLGAVLLGNTLVSLWPARFFTPWFWVWKQTAYDLLKLAIALELLYRSLRAFPGTWRTARVVVLTVLSTSAFVLAVLTPRSAVWTMWEWQPSIATATIWLLTAVGLLVVWYQLPIAAWPRAILLGFAPYLLVFITFMDVVRRHGWRISWLAGIVDSLAYLALVLFWVRVAWRREPAALPAQPSFETTVRVAPSAAMMQSGVGDAPSDTERLA